MKTFILTLSILFSLGVFASSSPYQPWAADFAQDANHFPIQAVRGYYDLDTVGGALGNYNAGITLPANAVIKHTHFEVSTAFVDGGSGTVSLGCAGVADLFASADITGSSTDDYVEGIQDNAVANFTKLSEKCNVRVHIDGAVPTEGELNIFVQYFLSK